MHPRDRVRVAEPDATPASEEADNGWLRLETAVISDEAEPVTLSAAEARELARHKPVDWREYRLGRIAEWPQLSASSAPS